MKGSNKDEHVDTSESLEGCVGHVMKPGLYTKDREKPQNFKESDAI